MVGPHECWKPEPKTRRDSLWLALGPVRLWETVLSSLFQPRQLPSALTFSYVLFQPPGERRLSFISRKLGKDFDLTCFIQVSTSGNCSPGCGHVAPTRQLWNYRVDEVEGSQEKC